LSPRAGFLGPALAYAAMGWPVFPLRPGRKVPLIAKAVGGNGVHDATCDEAQVKAWWTRSPDANLGLACGVAFWGLDVDYKGWPDVDPEAAFPDGADTITALQQHFGPLPPTVRQHTGGLGWQHLFRPDPRIRNGNRLEVGGQAAMAIGGCGSLAARKRCPKPVPSVPL
jgi:putative DNA primase/helicase